LNEESILVTLKDIIGMTKELCDNCTKKYENDLKIGEYTAKFVDPKKQEVYQEDEDEIFFIDPKNDIIDIHEMLIQAIKLQEPIIKRCNTCEKTIQDDIDDADTRDSFESSENVIIRS